MIRITVELDLPEENLLGLKEQLAMALEGIPGVKRVFIPKITVEQQKLPEVTNGKRR